MRRRKIGFAVAALVTSVAAPAALFAEEPQAVPTSSASASGWQERYEGARERLIQREFGTAEVELRELARIAPTRADRRLALEMAQLAATLNEREETLATAPPPKRRPRTTDEISLLYATSFLYGVGTGAWFLLQVEPDSALTATLPFIAITATPVVALAIIDGHEKLPHSVPHALSAGLYLGLGQGIWLMSYERARARRLEESGAANLRWEARDTATVLWAGATLGAVTGGALGFGVPTTPGRVSFTASTTIWSGVLTGFAAGALLPDSSRRAEHSMLIAGAGYNAGLFGGMLFASDVSPTVTRVRVVDLCGVAGGVAFGGAYLALAHRDADSRAALGLTAAGAGLGLAVGWFATRSMPHDRLTGSAPAFTVQPTVLPAAGGVVAGLAGTL